MPALAAACAAAALLAGVLAGWRAFAPGSERAASGPSLSPARHASERGRANRPGRRLAHHSRPGRRPCSGNRIRRRHPLRARGGRRALRGRPASIPDLPRACRAGDGAGDRHAVPGATSGRPFHGLGHGRTRPGVMVAVARGAGDVRLHFRRNRPLRPPRPVRPPRPLRPPLRCGGERRTQGRTFCSRTQTVPARRGSPTWRSLTCER